MQDGHKIYVQIYRQNGQAFIERNGQEKKSGGQYKIEKLKESKVNMKLSPASTEAYSKLYSALHTLALGRLYLILFYFIIAK